MEAIPKKLAELAERLKAGDVPRRATVRAVLKWFGASRRGANVLSDVKTVLANLGLQTDPDFEEAGIDELVRFKIVSADGSEANSHKVEEQTSEADTIPSADAEIDLETSGATEDQLEPEQKTSNRSPSLTTGL